MPYVKRIDLFRLEITLGSAFYEQYLEQGRQPTDHGMEVELGEEMTRLNTEH